MSFVEKSREMKFKWDDKGFLTWSEIITEVDNAEKQHITKEKDKYDFAILDEDDEDRQEAVKQSKKALLKRLEVFLNA